MKIFRLSFIVVVTLIVFAFAYLFVFLGLHMWSDPHGDIFVAYALFVCAVVIVIATLIVSIDNVIDIIRS